METKAQRDKRWERQLALEAAQRREEEQRVRLKREKAARYAEVAARNRAKRKAERVAQQKVWEQKWVRDREIARRAKVAARRAEEALDRAEGWEDRLKALQEAKRREAQWVTALGDAVTEYTGPDDLRRCSTDAYAPAPFSPLTYRLPFSNTEICVGGIRRGLTYRAE